MTFTEYLAGAHSGFDHKRCGEIEYLVCPGIEAAGLCRHAFFSRCGGVSPSPYDSLNFSVKREGSEQNVLRNFALAADAMGVTADSCVRINYEHGSNVLHVTADDCGAGVTGAPTAIYSDGLAANNAGVTLVTIHADCLPLFFLDTKTPSVALCHAGWRGVYTHIAVKAIDMLRGFGARPQDILCAIGPCICRDCFEVGDDIASLFAREFGDGIVTYADDRPHVDLAVSVAHDIHTCGVPAGNLTLSGECTCCDPDLYFSHRREHGATGSMASFMLLK